MIIKCPRCKQAKVQYDRHLGCVFCLGCGLSDDGRHVQWIKEDNARVQSLSGPELPKAR